MTEANLPDSAEANEIELEVSELAPAADTYVPPNMAGKKELVKLARDFIVKKKTGYVAQAQRDKQKDTLDLADKMLRISAEKSTVDRGTLNSVSSESASHASAAPSAGNNSARSSIASTSAPPRASATIDNEEFANMTPADVPLACSIDDPDCEACQ